MAKKKIDYTDWTKEDLVKEISRIKETTYGLVWHRDVPHEKIDVIINPDARTPEEVFSNEVSGKPFPVLKEVKGKKIITDESNPVNLIIEGDNYHSLAVLNFTHKEKVDVIYIDPPYNTGNNDFVYNDKFVDLEDTYRHSKWLSFIAKRLHLAKNLLKETGVIFISIDDNEFAQLKLLCDQIFGESNFISMLSVENNPKGRKNSSFISTSNEFCLIYAKDKTKSHFTENVPKQESDLALDENGVYVHNSGKRVLVGENKFNPAVTDKKSSKHYAVYFNEAKNDLRIEKEDHIEDINKTLLNLGYQRFYSHFRGEFVLNTYTKNKLVQLFNSNALDFKNGKIYEKNFSTKIRLKSLVVNRQYDAVINNEKAAYKIDVKTTSAGTELKNIFGTDKLPFDNPKNIGLLKLLITLFEDKNLTVLDFFAGSGTTGHAVLSLNQEDGGARKFILCTNNENDISTDVTYPRVSKVMSGYKDTKGGVVSGLGGNLRYFTAYDFVESEPTDKNKRKLVKKSTEMLCIKEDVYDLVAETDEYKILKNPQDKYMGVIFYEDAIPAFKNELSKIKHKVNTYVFSLGDDPHRAEFKDVKNKVVLQPIPDVILRVYREIFK